MAKIRSLLQFHLITKVLIAPFIIQQHCKPMYVQSYKDLFWCKCPCFQEYTAEDLPGALNDLVRFFFHHWPCLSADKYIGIPGRTSLQKVPPKFTDLRRILKYFFHQRRDKRINEIPNTLPID